MKKDKQERIEELRAAIRRKVRDGDSHCGMTEHLRRELWNLENIRGYH